MGTKENEETNRPLGVLGCLMAGFEMLGHNWWLLALPVFLDLFFWLGPQLSILPLIQSLVASIKGQPMPDAETARQFMLQAQTLDQIGKQFNLLSLLSAVPLLSIPSLLAQHAPGILSPVGERAVFVVQNPLVVLGWTAVLIPASLVLGFMYLNSLANSVHTLRQIEKEPASNGGEGQEATERPKHTIPGCNVILKLVRAMLFYAGLMVAGIIFLPLWLTVIVTAAEIADFLLMLMWGLSIGMISFVVLHLLFVVHGVLLGERGLFRAILESIALIRANFGSSAALVLAMVLIYQGLGYVWSLPSSDSWLLLIGILGNSCIATGLITGTFVFYQERMRILMGGKPLATT
jgi:hypothetical protein